MITMDEHTKCVQEVDKYLLLTLNQRESGWLESDCSEMLISFLGSVLILKTKEKRSEILTLRGISMVKRNVTSEQDSSLLLVLPGDDFLSYMMVVLCPDQSPPQNQQGN